MTEFSPQVSTLTKNGEPLRKKKQKSDSRVIYNFKSSQIIYFLLIIKIAREGGNKMNVAYHRRCNNASIYIKM